MGSTTPMVSAKDIRHDWYVVDATNQVLGRLATRVARVLANDSLQIRERLRGMIGQPRHVGSDELDDEVSFPISTPATS